MQCQICSFIATYPFHHSWRFLKPSHHITNLPYHYCFHQYNPTIWWNYSEIKRKKKEMMHYVHLKKWELFNKRDKTWKNKNISWKNQCYLYFNETGSIPTFPSCWLIPFFYWFWKNKRACEKMKKTEDERECDKLNNK